MANLPKKPTIKFSIFWIYGAIILALVGMWYMDNNTANEKISYSTFGQIMSDTTVAKNNGVKKLMVYSKQDYAEAYVSDSLFRALYPNSSFNKEELKNARICFRP